MPTHRHVLGWHRSTRPSQHARWAASPHLAGLPASVDLQPQCPPVYDQGQLGSCTSNAEGGLFQFLQMKLGMTSWTPSRLMLYYGERQMEGTINEDAGANGDDGITFLQGTGIAPESDWPYVVSKFAQKPPAAAYADAASNKLLSPVTIADGDVASLKARLALGFPVAFGFDVYESFESDAVASSGVVPMPGSGEQAIGGHEVLLVGYDDARQMFKCRNSWGADWGLAGYFWMPYAYIADTTLSGDFRSASGVTGNAPGPGPSPTPTPPVIITSLDSRGIFYSVPASGEVQLVTGPAPADGSHVATMRVAADGATTLTVDPSWQAAPPNPT